MIPIIIIITIFEVSNRKLQISAPIENFNISDRRIKISSIKFTRYNQYITAQISTTIGDFKAEESMVKLSTTPPEVSGVVLGVIRQNFWWRRMMTPARNQEGITSNSHC